MSSPRSRITSQGRISIPAEIRRKLGVGPGSVLEWQDEGDRVVVRRAARYSSEDIHRAVFTRPPEPQTSIPALGFSDCLILEIARKAGHVPLGTFDKRLSKLNGVERL